MTCYKHPNMGAVARCEQCGREICAACATEARGKVVCRDCADIIRSQPEPAVEQPQPEPPAVEDGPSSDDGGPSPEPAKTVPTAGPADNVRPAGEASGVPATVPPAAIAPSVPSPPPALHDAGAGGQREKESILSAALSLLLPGAGQIYNGQVAKGIILAALYVGSIAIIFGGAVVTVLSASYFNTSRNMCCCCLPLFILPLILLVYAIFDAYNTAEKINNHEAVRDWL